MDKYKLAQLNDNQVKQLNDHQEKISEEIGKDLILIAYHDLDLDKE